MRKARFPFTEEHDALRGAIRDLVERELAPNTRAQTPDQGCSRQVLRQLARRNFLGLQFGEAYGGAGGNHLHAAVLCEELARSGSAELALSICSHIDLALPLIEGFGTEAQKQRYLVPAIKAEKLGALTVAEQTPGPVNTYADKVEGGWIVNGRKTCLANSQHADFYVAAVRTTTGGERSGVSILIIDDGDGVTAASQSHLGWRCSSLGRIAFQDVFVPDDNLLGEPNGGPKLIMENVQWERLALSLSCIARAQAGLEAATAAVKSQGRTSWAANSFHANREAIVQLTCDVHVARTQTYAALHGHDLGQDCAVDVSMASLLAQRVALATANECVLLMGGAAPASGAADRTLHDAALYRHAFGDNRLAREICGDALGL